MGRDDKYSELQEYSVQREREMLSMLQPYIEATDRYGRLLCRLSNHVGTREPASIQDSVVRDLMADIFDFLYEVRPFIAKGQTLIAFPMARRAYESLSLLHLCVLDEGIAEKWASGKEIKNEKIRISLGKHPMGEPKEELRKLYKFFCEMTHPNRKMIAYRGLGEGNTFVFGSIGVPNLVEVADYCIKHLELWYWLCPILAWFYRESLFSADPTFHDDHNEAREFAQSVKRWLVEQYNNVLAEWKVDKKRIEPKFI